MDTQFFIHMSLDQPICSHSSLQRGTNSHTNRAQQPHLPAHPHTLSLHQKAQLIWQLYPWISCHGGSRTADLQVAGVGMDRAAIHAALPTALPSRPTATQSYPCASTCQICLVLYISRTKHAFQGLGFRVQGLGFSRKVFFSAALFLYG